MLSTKKTIMFNGYGMWTIDANHYNNFLSEKLSLERIGELIANEDLDECDLVMLNAHGTTNNVDNSGIHHSMQLENKTFIHSFGIFNALAEAKLPITIATFACYSSACCREDHGTLKTTVPKTLMGFYAPAKEVSRKEVNHEMQNKLLTLKKNGVSLSDALWIIAPLSQGRIAYHHPEKGIQYFELPYAAGFDYKIIKSQKELMEAKLKSINEYNKFKQQNGLPSMIAQAKNYLDWFKDQWFMQMVTELVASDERRKAVIDYLSTVDDSLKLHTMSLSSKPKNNLLEYFKCFNNPKDQPIIAGLEKVFSIDSKLPDKSHKTELIF